MNNFELTKCMCCHDANHFTVLVHEVENIVRNIETLLYSFRIDDIEFKKWKSKIRLNSLYLIQTDSKHPHFMCGYCFQVNLDSLRIAEDSLRNVLYKVCYVIETEEKDKTRILLNNVLNSLAGHYPCTYMNLSQFYKKTKENYNI